MSPKTYRIAYQPAAEIALDETIGYIARTDGPQRAANWLRKMLEAVDALETMPALFRQRGTWKGRAIHAKPVMCHLVYYVIIEQDAVVSVIDIAGAAEHTKRAEYGDTGRRTVGSPCVGVSSRRFAMKRAGRLCASPAGME